MEKDILYATKRQNDFEAKFMGFCRFCLQYHDNLTVNIFADQNDEHGNTKPAISEILFDLFRIEVSLSI